MARRQDDGELPRHEEISALGRDFQLGYLYDIRDELLMQVWPIRQL